MSFLGACHGEQVNPSVQGDETAAMKDSQCQQISVRDLPMSLNMLPVDDAWLCKVDIVWPEFVRGVLSRSPQFCSNLAS